MENLLNIDINVLLQIVDKIHLIDVFCVGSTCKTLYNVIFSEDKILNFLTEKYIHRHLDSIKKPLTSVKSHQHKIDYLHDIVTRFQIKKSIAKRKSIFLTGPGGCGKTHILNEICDKFVIAKGEYQTASTGTSSSLMPNGRTIHSLFRKFTIYEKEQLESPKEKTFGYIDRFSSEKLKKVMRYNKEALEILRSVTRLRIDEISMLSAFFMQYLHYLMIKIRPDQSDKPFGGVQLIMSGDFCQLRPVPQKNPENIHTSQFMYNCDFWKDIKIFTLRYSFRQMIDEEFSQFCRSIRHGIVEQEQLKVFKKMILKEDQKPNPQAVHIYTTNRKVDEYNQNVLDENPNPEITIERTYDINQRCSKDEEGNKFKCQVPYNDKEAIEKFITERTDIQKEIKLKKDATAMIIRNISIKDNLTNGTHGKIESIQQETIPSEKKNNSTETDKQKHYELVKEYSINFKVSSTGQTHVIEKHKRMIIEPCGCKIAVEQIPMRLAYAITAHKSQGMTLSNVHVHIPRGTEAALVYVILTRVASFENITIERDFCPDGITVDPRVLEFYSGEKEILPFKIDEQKTKDTGREEENEISDEDLLKLKKDLLKQQIDLKKNSGKVTKKKAKIEIIKE